MKKWIIAAAAVAISMSGAAYAQSTQKLDGEIYIGDDAPPPAVNRTQTDTTTLGDYGTGSAIQYQVEPGGKVGFYERTLARWRDPTTPPHVRNICVKWFKTKIPGDGTIKTCTGWKVQYQWYERWATLAVSTKEPADIPPAVERCLAVAGVAAAISAIAVGGEAALPAAEGAMTGCLKSELSDVISVSINLSGRWTDWG